MARRTISKRKKKKKKGPSLPGLILVFLHWIIWWRGIQSGLSLAPKIAKQTSDGQLCGDDCAPGWPVWIRGGFTVNNSGMVVCAGSSDRQVGSSEGEKRPSNSGKCTSQSDLFQGTDSIGHLVAFQPQNKGALTTPTVPGGLAKRPFTIAIMSLFFNVIHI